MTAAEPIATMLFATLLFDLRRAILIILDGFGEVGKIQWRYQ